HVLVTATYSAEPKTAFAAQRLHGEGERRLGFDQGTDVDLVLVVKVDVEIISGELDVVRRRGTRHQPHLEGGRDLGGAGLEASSARLRYRGVGLAGHEDVSAVALQAQAHVQQPPARVFVDRPERARVRDAQPFGRDIW